MAKILVHLHIFYPDQTDYFIEKLSNIVECEWELYVTLIEKDERIQDSFRKFKQDTHFIVTGNKGYDILPFIKVIRSIQIDQYDYIIKLHTKGPRNNARINSIDFNGYEWRNELVESILKDRKHFLRLLRIFGERPDIGLACSDILYMKSSSMTTSEDHSLLENELSRIGMKTHDRNFCGGTMFFARACIYRFLQDSCISEDMFDCQQHTGAVGSLAHVYERILSIAASEYSYRTYRVVTDWKKSFKVRASRALKWLLSIERRGENQGKTLTVLGLRIKVSTQKKKFN